MIRFAASMSGLEHLQAIQTNINNPLKPDTQLTAQEVVEDVLNAPHIRDEFQRIPRLDVQVDPKRDGTFWIRLNRIFNKDFDAVFSRDPHDDGGYAILDSFDISPEDIAKKPVQFALNLVNLLFNNEKYAYQRYEVENLYRGSCAPIGEPELPVAE